MLQNKTSQKSTGVYSKRGPAEMPGEEGQTLLAAITGT